MRVWNAGRTLASLGLMLALAGCAAAGTVNTQVTSGTVEASTAAPQTSTVVITRTVLVTSTVFATVTAGSGAPSAPATSRSATEPSTLTVTTSATSSAATASASTESTPTAHVTPTPLPGSLPVAGAANVTLAFLAALEKDPSGASSLQYLSTRLQGVAHSGHSVASIMGIQNMYSHYQAAAAVSRGGGRAATVDITLTYASGPVMRVVTLIPEGGAWRIDDIADTSA